MRSIICLLVLACVWGLILTGQAQARTWTVEKDGSGDFTIIQDALDAASPGDSVVVGPGRYEDFTQRSFVGGTIEAIAWIEKSDITLVGTHRETVILGPSVPPPNTNTHIWIGISVEPTTGVVIESLMLERMFGGIDNRGDLTLRNVSSSDHEERGLTNNGAYPLTVQDCSFERNGDFGLFLGTDDYNVLVERCVFVDNGEALVARTTQGIIVRDCFFDASGRMGTYAGGVNIQQGAVAEVTNCQFGEFPPISGVAMGALSSSQVTLSDCVFEASGEINLIIQDASHLEGADNIFGGGTWASIDIRDRATATLTGNHIFNVGEYSVRVRNYFLPGTYPIHLENNWWGTADEKQVAQWIYDEPDGDGIFTPIYWQPIAGQPIPAEETSFGELKARFGGR